MAHGRGYPPACCPEVAYFICLGMSMRLLICRAAAVAGLSWANRYTSLAGLCGGVLACGGSGRGRYVAPKQRCVTR